MAVAAAARVGLRVSGAMGALLSRASYAQTQEEMEQQKLLRRLTAGQRSLRRIRVLIGTTMIVAGSAFLVMYAAMFKWRTTLFARDICGASGEAHLAQFFMELGFYGRFVFFSLAPLADSLWIPRLVLLVDAAVFIGAIVLGYAQRRTLEEEVDRWHGSIGWFKSAPYVYTAYAASFLVGSAYALRYHSAKRLQEYMWRLIAAFVGLGLPVNMAKASLLSVHCNKVSTAWWGVLAELGTLAVAAQPAVREGLQGALHRAVAGHHSSHLVAAGIAGLVGDIPLQEALSLAEARFRSISIAELEPEDVATNRPDPELFSRTARAALEGGCDVFVSHSWSDDNNAKWAALQDWRHSFLRVHGREPLLWFDKCCLDQANIKDDLRCLPIFLSGCRSLLVLCGPSYLSRLWCIMEIFTFTYMHRGDQTIEFVPVVGQDDEERDWGRIRDSLHLFDARNCRSSIPEEAEQFMSIIRAAFGSIEEFNKVVRRVFETASLQEAMGSTRRSCSLRTSALLAYDSGSDDEEVEPEETTIDEDGTGASDLSAG